MVSTVGAKFLKRRHNSRCCGGKELINCISHISLRWAHMASFRATEKEAKNLEAQRRSVSLIDSNTVLSSTSTAKAKNLNRETLKTADSAHSLHRLLIYPGMFLCFHEIQHTQTVDTRILFLPHMKRAPCASLHTIKEGMGTRLSFAPP